MFMKKRGYKGTWQKYNIRWDMKTLQIKKERIDISWDVKI